MTANKNQIFEFGDFVLAPAERLLLRRGRPLRLTPKTFDLLVALVRHRGHLVSKDQLLDEVWPKTFVAEVNLSVNISTLRRLLGRNRGRQEFIQTVSKRGYRFVAPTKTSDNATTLFLRTGARRTSRPPTGMQQGKTLTALTCRAATAGAGGPPRGSQAQSSTFGAHLHLMRATRRLMPASQMRVQRKVI
jgi:DNA-binding winged helix-turn-helix (wHTH) protein